MKSASPLPTARLSAKPQNGQVAQLVERGPEKAGVGGSIPSLATIHSKTYAWSISPNLSQGTIGEHSIGN